MPSLSIRFGLILVLLGIVGYVIGVTNGNASFTAMIPSIFGVLMVIFGLAANAKEDMRKHFMHGSVLVALVGFIAVAMQMARKAGELSATPAVISQVIMLVVCLLFVIFSVRSFIAARQA